MTPPTPESQIESLQRLLAERTAECAVMRGALDWMLNLDVPPQMIRQKARSMLLATTAGADLLKELRTLQIASARNEGLMEAQDKAIWANSKCIAELEAQVQAVTAERDGERKRWAERSQRMRKAVESLKRHQVAQHDPHDYHLGIGHALQAIDTVAGEAPADTQPESELERKLQVATEALTGIRHACEEGLDVPYCTIISVRGRADKALAEIELSQGAPRSESKPAESDGGSKGQSQTTELE